MSNSGMGQGRSAHCQDLSGLVKNAALRTRVFDMLEDEFLRSRRMILSISGQRELLAGNRVLARSVICAIPTWIR